MPFRQVADRVLLVLLGLLLPGLGILGYLTISYHRMLVAGRWPLGAFRFDPDTGFGMTPSFSGVLTDGHHVRIHRLGHRISADADREEHQPGGVLALGDSFVYGDEVEAEDTFTHVLGQRLGRPSYNYGVCAYSYASMLRRLEQLVRSGLLEELSPRVLLLGAGDWLVPRSFSPFPPSEGMQYAYPHLEVRGGRIVVVDPPDEFSTRHLFDFQASYFPEGRRDVPLDASRVLALWSELPRVLRANYLGNRQRRRLREDLPVSRERVFDFLLDEVYRLLGTRDVGVVVLWLPSEPGQTMDPALAAAVARHPEALLVDGSRALRAAAVKPEEYCCGRHPQPAAHRAYAAALEERIRTVWER